jgi:DNA-binding MarR family transcriptional regulator
LSSFAPLLKAASGRERGPSPSFSDAHFVLAFLAIGDGGTIGRQALARRAGLGDGAVRTVLKKLKEDGLVETNASGCFLTPSGKKVFERIREKVSPVVPLERSPLTVGNRQVAVAIRGSAPKVRTGIEQRDAAIKAGAMGATTYVMRDLRFAIPGGSSDCEADFPSSAWGRLRAELKPKEGDAVVLCGSDDGAVSELGALAAALTLA